MYGVRRQPPEREAGFLQAVREVARVYGWLVYHTWRSIKSPAGFPDLVLVKPPVIIFAELKTATGRVTAEQQRWLDDL